MKSKSLNPFIAAFAGCLFAAPAFAQTNRTWTGTGGTAWNNAGSWTGGIPDDATEVAYFNSNATNPASYSGTVTLGGFNFASGSSGRTLTFTGDMFIDQYGIIVGDTSGFAITGAGTTTLTANQTWAVNVDGSNEFTFSRTTVATGGYTLSLSGSNTGTGTISANITGLGGITKTGSGTWILSGTSNSYSGLTTISNGVLNIRNVSALGGTGSGTSVSSGAALQIQGGIITAAEALALDGTGIANDGALRNISGDNTYAGGITNNSSTRINSDSGTLTLDVASGNAITGSDDNLTFGGAGSITVADAIATGTGTVTKDGNGILTLSGTNTYTGLTDVQVGTLTLGANNIFADASTIRVSGGILSQNTRTDTVAGVQLTAGSITGTTGVLTSTTAFDLQAGSVSAILGGSVGVNKTTSGTVTLSGANTYTGLTDIQAGTLTLGANNIFADASTIKVSGGILSQNTRTDTVSGVQLTSGSITGTGGVLTSTTAFDLQTGSVSAILGGSVGVNKTTSGTVTLSGANTYTGATAISNGVLNIQNANALGTIVGATTVSDGAALEIQGTFTTLAEALTLNGAGIAADGALRNISGSSIYAGAITLNSATRINSDSGTLTLNVTSGNAIAGTNQNLTFGGAGNVTVSDAISIGSGTITKDGAGTLVLSVVNTYTGGTTIDEGVLNFGVAGAIGGSGANVTVNSGGTVAAGYAIDQTFLSRIAGTSSGVVALGVNSGNALNFNTAGLTAARLGASGTFTYSGTLTPNGTTYRVGGGGGALTISTALTGSGNSLDMGLGGTPVGNVVLTAANTFGGSTTISGGTITLSGTNGAIASSSGITINSGGTLTLNDQTVNANRIANVAITLNGGTFGYVSTSGDHTETVGQLSLGSGASTVDSSTTGTGTGDSSALTFASLIRTVGATVNFTDASGTMSAANNDNNVRFTSTTGLTGTIMGGYATVNGAGWATYNASGTASVEALGTYVTTATNGNTATNYNNDNLDVTTSQAPDAVITPNSIRFNNATARTLTLQGTTNTITSGGILVTAAATNGGTITGGTLRGASGTDLVVHQYSAGDFSINSIIENSGGDTGLTKSGTRTLILGGTNTYTGLTSINAGTLVVNGNQSGATGAMSVASVAALLGTGTIGGATTILGTHSSGASAGAVGTQNFSSSLTYSSGSIFEWDLNVTSGTATFDKVVAGSLGGSGAEFKIVGTGDGYATAFWDSTRNWTATELFGVNNATVNLSTIFTTTTSFDPSPLQGSFSFTSTGGGTGNQLTWTAVPEPTSALAGILLGAGLLRRRRTC